MSSAVGLYTQFGAQAEDFETLLVALAVWTTNRQLSVADLLAQIQLVNSAKEPIQSKDDFDQVASKAQDGKRVRIDRTSFLKYLNGLPATEIIKVLGIPWKNKPSVKLFSSAVHPQLGSYPQILKDCIAFHSEDVRGIMDVAHNKIKHGPQVCAAELRRVVESRGEEFRDYDDIGEGTFLRLLFSGARTQEQDGELEQGQRVAPFLNHDVTALVRLFYRIMAHEAHVMAVAIKFILAYELRAQVAPLSEDVLAFTLEKVEWLRRNPY